MSKPYSAWDLSAQLTADRTWRIREISDLKAAIEEADDIGRRVLLRALVTICYAHWEGYVRFAAKKYLEHVALRKIEYGELNRQFLRNYFLPRLASLPRGNLRERCGVVDEILDASAKRFSRVNDDLINTQSNLNSEVLTDICLVCDVPHEPFEDKKTFIDVLLLKRRNAIAHGEETFVDFADAQELVDTSMELIRTFGDALENKAALKSYRLVPET